MSKQDVVTDAGPSRSDHQPRSDAASDPATALGRWALSLHPDESDLDLAGRALVDTLACVLAARGHRLEQVVGGLPDGVRWAALGHVLDFDDLHMESTAHVSVVCVPAALAARGGIRSYLAAAGVMARLGAALGWGHYTSGWHATCTAGAAAAAVAGAVAFGLDEQRTATAIALAVPAAGGVQRAFGTDGKSLQVGFAVDAGLRAARLAAAGATADPAALREWIRLVAPEATAPVLSGPAVPGGLAIKLFPCCYALQRPIAAVRSLRDGSWTADDVARVRVATPAATVAPLLHHRPRTGLQAKFSLEYAVATAVLDDHPGFAVFEDAAVARPRARELVERVKIATTPGGRGLLDGECAVEIELRDGRRRATSLALPPGAPGRPPTAHEFAAKLRDCGPDVVGLTDTMGADWAAAATLLRTAVPPAQTGIGDHRPTVQDRAVRDI